MALMTDSRAWDAWLLATTEREPNMGNAPIAQAGTLVWHQKFLAEIQIDRGGLVTIRVFTSNITQAVARRELELVADPDTARDLYPQYFRARV